MIRKTKVFRNSKLSAGKALRVKKVASFVATKLGIKLSEGQEAHTVITILCNEKVCTSPLYFTNLLLATATKYDIGYSESIYLEIL